MILDQTELPSVQLPLLFTKFWPAGIDFQLLQAQFNDGLRVKSIQVFVMIDYEILQQNKIKILTCIT